VALQVVVLSTQALLLLQLASEQHGILGSKITLVQLQLKTGVQPPLPLQTRPPAHSSSGSVFGAIGVQVPGVFVPLHVMHFWVAGHSVAQHTPSVQ
jgi:hypothetical protein